MADNFKPVQAQSFALAGAGAIIGATSITLKSFAGIDGAPLVMANFGSVGYGTLEPGNGELEEQISFTGVVQNANGTATLTGIKNVLFIYPYTETSGLAKTHAGSTEFVLSNTSAFYAQFIAKNNDGIVTETITFENPNYPRMDSATPPPVDDEQLATKKYVDDVAIAGSPLATDSVYGISKLSVVAANVLDPIVVGTNDPRIPLQDEKDALAGTVGTPSNTNRYVTDDDTLGTGDVVRESEIDGFSSGNIFGDGSDGAVIISSNTTLTRDMYYTDLTINSTFTLDTGGYRIFGNGVLINNGTIRNNGANASGTTGGSGGAGGSLKSGGTGGAGGNITAGGNAGGGGGGAGIVFISFREISVQGVIQAIGGNGGNAVVPSSGSLSQSSGTAGGVGTARVLGAGTGGTGGQTTQGPQAGGAGGSITSSASILAYRIPAIIFPMVDWFNLVALSGGSGGGGGAYAFNSPAGTGGGGGGGGGTVFIFYQVLTNPTTPTVTGGSGGTLAGSAANGAAGSSGTVYQIQII